MKQFILRLLLIIAVTGILITLILSDPSPSTQAGVVTITTALILATYGAARLITRLFH